MFLDNTDWAGARWGIEVADENLRDVLAVANHPTDNLLRLFPPNLIPTGILFVVEVRVIKVERTPRNFDTNSMNHAIAEQVVKALVCGDCQIGHYAQRLQRHSVSRICHVIHVQPGLGLVYLGRVGLADEIAEPVADPIPLVNAQVDFLEADDIGTQGHELIHQKMRALAPARLSFAKVERGDGDLRHLLQKPNYTLIRTRRHYRNRLAACQSSASGLGLALGRSGKTMSSLPPNRVYISPLSKSSLSRGLTSNRYFGVTVT
jgi:hypothetical protein